jgi:gliding motility-associated-like protein
MSIVSYSQQLFYQDVFYGGVTGGGFSSGVGDGASGQIIVNIDPTSTIKKAYLFCNRYGDTQPVNVTLNSNSYNFNSSNQIGNNFLTFTSPIDTIICAIHAIDVTNNINPLVNTYNISYPNQITNLSDKYGAFYLLVVYENLTLPRITVSVTLNEKDMASSVSYQITNLLPIDSSNPVGLAIHSDILWNTPTDGSNITVNSNNIGLIKGSDNVNSIWTGAGVKGHFYYQNNTLFGLDDDTPDSLMAGTDGLADIKNYVNNGDTSLNVLLTYESQQTKYNIYLAFFLTYTTPCDTFSTSITANDTICFGDSIQLNATGGSQYSWFSVPNAFGSGLSDTSIANPKASPPQTTTYIVTIKNDSGCVKTEQVKIWVNPLPIPSQNVVVNNICGSAVGSLTVGNIPSGNSPYSYTLTNLQTNSSEFQVSSLFDSLVAGNYEIQIIDNNGCVWKDTVTVTEVNNVVANFTANPQSGIAPLNVDFTNTSLNANAFQWSIISSQGDTVFWIPACAGNTSNCGFSYTFDSAGTYQVCLVAFNNIPTCADTICQTIIVEDEISLIIPNVFTPNGDGNNDNFVIQLTGASLIKELKAEVFNRWGEIVQSKKFKVESFNQQFTLWDGRTTAAALAPEGTYFYVISYETLDGEVKSEKGSITLLR